MEIWKYVLVVSLSRYHDTSVSVSYVVVVCGGTGSLATMIKNHGSLSERMVRAYTRQMLSGLAYLHRNTIVHRGTTSLASQSVTGPVQD